LKKQEKQNVSALKTQIDQKTPIQTRVVGAPLNTQNTLNSNESCNNTSRKKQVVLKTTQGAADLH